jgi:hypothetical protein
MAKAARGHDREGPAREGTGVAPAVRTKIPSSSPHGPQGCTWRRAAALNGRLARHREERATKEPKEADWMALQVYSAIFQENRPSTL